MSKQANRHRCFTLGMNILETIVQTEFSALLEVLPQGVVGSPTPPLLPVQAAWWGMQSRLQKQTLRPDDPPLPRSSAEIRGHLPENSASTCRIHTRESPQS